MRRASRCAGTPLCRSFANTAAGACPKQPPSASGTAAELHPVSPPKAPYDKLEEQNAYLKDTLCAIKDLLQQLVAGQQRIESKQAYNLEHAACLAQAQQPFSLNQKAAGEKARADLLVAAHTEQHLSINRFAIDPVTPQSEVRLKDPHTAVRASPTGYVTLRASQPLSATNHRWAVKIHRAFSSISLGLLPKLATDMEAKMGSTNIDKLGGWCIDQDASSSYVWGDWTCRSISFAKGDLVLFDYSFRDKMLTIRCGDKEVEGHIPNAGEELYPAFSLYFVGEKVSFEKYP